MAEQPVHRQSVLRGRNVVMFPDTDPDGIAFRRWSEAAELVKRQLFWADSPPIRVSPLLELHATKIQIVLA